MCKMLLADTSLGLIPSIEVKLLIITILESIPIHSNVAGS